MCVCVCVCVCVCIVMMMNCCCGMVDWRKVFNVISIWDHCQRFSLSQISDTPPGGLEPAENQSIGFVELGCMVVITTTP